ncbi:multicopper oxidase-domain-containing protein [Aspergillus alliaceus]|uniref:Multicopper oxidase-domain-containing protein n=1 Tax=Petromyces alliaceus TaxID=209559 RepID=A0A5N7BZT0_PETAA|nr:multicopper oxidase-domain-containing protein [Aspergillus alliaceus]
MERKSSRRKSKPSKITDRKGSETGSSNAPPRRTTKDWPYSILICPLIVCILIVLLFLQQFSAPDPLRSVLPLPGTHHEETLHPKLHSPDLSRPRIELQPEDHIYRSAVTRHLDWVVTADHLRPDGVSKRVYLVNDLFPGPTIEARSGDTLIINVTNALPEESIAIHWHGLHIHNAMDGVPGVTQSAIPPGSTFMYNLTIPHDQSGTFWYHGHTGTSRADGLYGGFVVHAPASRATVRGLMSRHSVESVPYGYEREFLLLIGDWYHRSGDQVLAWYMSIDSFGNEPAPDSLLINGMGNFNCSMAVPARPVDCIEQDNNLSYLTDIETAYRLRVVNTGSLAGFTLSFSNNHLTVIQIDSTDIEPQQASSAGILYPGQRIDIILPPPKDNSTSLTIHLDEECFNFPNPALTPTQTIPIASSYSPLPENLPQDSQIDLHNTPSTPSLLSQLPEKASQTHVIYTKIQKLSINHNIPNGFFNRTSWRPQSQPLNTLPRNKWDENQFSFATEAAGWIDLVVNNLDEGGHPFHLHGHHFYVLRVHEASIGWGSYNPFVDSDPPGLEPGSGYDLSRAMLRDTVYIPSRGYAVLRFRADNPGVWLFHCHIVWHLASGMAMVVDVGDSIG